MNVLWTILLDRLAMRIAADAYTMERRCGASAESAGLAARAARRDFLDIWYFK